MRLFTHKIFFLLLLINFLYGCDHKPQASYQGYVEGRLTYIASQASGALQTLQVHRGMMVKQRQALYQLIPQPQYAAVKQAQAVLQRAQANLANLQKGKRPSELAAIQAQQKQVLAQLQFSQKTEARYHSLFLSGHIQKQRYDKSLADVKNLQQKLIELKENLTTAKLTARIDAIKAAQARVTARQATLQQAQWRLQEKTVTAPVSGVVFDTYFRPGEVVKQEQPVLAILDPHEIRVIFFVPTPQLTKIKIGKKIKVKEAGGNKTFTATINFISPQAEYTPPVIYSRKRMDKLTYRVEAIPRQNPLQYHPGQPVTVYLK